MSDVTDDQVTDIPEGAEEGAPKKTLRKPLIIGGGLVALLLAGGGGAWFLAQSGASSVLAPTQAPVAEAFFFDLPVITVNLNTSGASLEYLKISAALEVRDQSMMSIIEPRMPRVLDAFQVYLRELRRSDLEGSAGIYRLKEELHRRVNLAVYPATVDNILFKEILVQ